MAEEDNSIAMQLRKTLDELGYFILDTNDEAEGVIFFKSVDETIKELFDNYSLRDKIIISITEDGNYVIPILKEKLGGAIISGIIADILGSQLILTSRVSQAGLYGIEEFAWINAIKILNPEKIPIYEEKLLKQGKLNVFSEEPSIANVEGYEIVDELDKADIVITQQEETISKEEKLIAKPLQLAVALSYSASVPKEALYFAIISTLKSINIRRRKIDFLIVPKEKESDEKIKEVSKFFSSLLLYIPFEKEKDDVCHQSLRFLQSRVVLKKAKRAYGIYTCLGIEKE